MMKKLPFLIILFPFFVLAQFESFETANLPTEVQCTDIKSCIVQYGNLVANILFILVAIGGVIAILIGAVSYILGSKDENQLKSAKKWLQNGLVAVILAALAYVIVNAVLGTLTK